MASTMQEFLSKALNEAETLDKETTYQRIKEWRKLRDKIDDDLLFLKTVMTQSNQAMVAKAYTGRMMKTLKDFEKSMKKIGLE